MEKPSQPGVAGQEPGKRPVLRWPPHRWALALVLASLLWRLVRYGVVFPMWGDEAFIAVNFITRSFGELAGPLDHPQIVPVGFFRTIRGWLEVKVAPLPARRIRGERPPGKAQGA